MKFGKTKVRNGRFAPAAEGATHRGGAFRRSLRPSRADDQPGAGLLVHPQPAPERGHDAALVAEAAERIEVAVKKVLAQGLRTPDIYSAGTTKVGTREMGEAVLKALG